ncbi:major facilitator superfamily MFS_1 [Streptomyces davaonensis JCM 4913]|uniref:Major facilitator superfamily MFS_1 n=1 Tax=Streptomyces davaonensis (strain DSM 101723 / JCM 4913 / KCC S-0913 / 768) TaxID=1214101 RepID=K4QXS9_STRDJ|nr:MFS transporter [Streptomyces davaonensis]CCK25189.1 major facilitator superfamily MFS_1 [Streptomyces davaonensis JCM 4913]
MFITLIGVNHSLRSARVATFVYFILCGTTMGTWVVNIPAIEERVDISHATLGGLLVLLGLGAFLGMQVAGRLTDRLGARVVVPATGVLCGAALVLPGLARDPWSLAGALLIFGFCNGCLDVAMNAHAVHVEKAYGRPVMSAFHATFSVGGVLAALVGAGTASAGLSPTAGMAAVGALSMVIALVSARALLPAAADTDTVDEAPTAEHQRGTGGRIWILAALALMVMLCEGAANDWSALHLKDVLGAPASAAASAYGTFAATMTIGRLLADRMVARVGSLAILRHGAVMAAAGITIVALAPWIWAAFVGWALFGLGLSGCVPQLFSAAGHADPAAAGANVSRVAGLGYVGMLAGPAVIGWLTHLVALNHAFVLLTLLCAITAVAAGVLRTAPDRTREPATSVN